MLNPYYEFGILIHEVTKGVLMASEEFVFVVVYFIITMCLLFTPTEFRAAGLTIENILSSWLGSEDMHFIYYHIKKTSANILVHSALPLGFYVGLGFVSPELNLFSPWLVSLPWLFFLCISIGMFAIAVSVFLLWKNSNWNSHPIAKSLGYHGSSWRAVTSSINVEFRRINKFQTGPPGRRTYVTDTWIIKTSPYRVWVAHQQDCHLNILKTEEHAVSHESSAGAQFVTLSVVSLNENIPDFDIRLNSIDYKDLKDKVSSPVLNARNVVIQQSMTERFLIAFRQQVDSNPTYSLPEGSPEPDNCIGCLQIQSNVKLIKRCDDLTTGNCVQCYCRPMWCCDCMCKWFASRQNQSRPETWLGGKSPCPTCRSVFCMLDISHITT
ncbi:hypothetical protein HOLleu_34202 [Holothuria leucospilota]|uniref:Transmembrane protein 129 n=1 Tax=Holothuria leucospilota TaxID=206669 RepID=A0A9Q0YPU8_HOLLE|nr:hypothetical protein HOLleu_34202 [Holothuria leucospilota]